MRQQLYYTTFAQAYGEGSYSQCVYNDTENCTSTGTGNTGTNNNGPLANTGFDILIIVTIACALIFVGLLMRIMRKKKNAKTTKSPGRRNDSPQQ